MEQAFCLDVFRIALKRRGSMEGYKQGHSVLWADEAEDEERSPDAGRETSEEQGGITRCPCSRAADVSHSRTRGLPTARAWTRGHSYRTTPAYAPTTGACSPVWPRPLGIRHSIAAEFGPPKTRAS